VTAVRSSTYINASAGGGGGGSYSVYNVGAGGGGSYSVGGQVTPGNVYYYPGNYANGSYTYPVNVSPELLSQPGVLDAIIEHLVTIVKPGEKVIVCVDTDLPSAQCNEIQEGLRYRGLPAIIIRGARAGTGFPSDPRLFDDPAAEDRHVDFLARMGEIWGLRPDLKFTDLLSWYTGNDMADADFVAAFETHFLKVSNGIHGRPQ
jgi:hypothetical protein